jgi:anti-anti-sigma factor
MTDTTRVSVHEEPDRTVVIPHGRIYFDTNGPLRDALLVLVAVDKPRVILDLSNVDVCDSTSLNMMAQAHRMAAQHGGWLRLAGVQPGVLRVLQATNLDRLLAIYDTVDDAARDSD